MNDCRQARARRAFAIALTFLVAARAAYGADTFADCERELERDPRARAAAECFLKIGDTSRDLEGAAARLQHARQSHAGSPWLTFYLAEVRARQKPATALDWFRDAAQEFAAARDAHGQVESHVRHGWAAFVAGRRADAWKQVAESLAAATASGDPHLVARAKLLEVWVIVQTGERLTRGQQLLQEVQASVFPNGPYQQRAQTLSYLGNIAFKLGQYVLAVGYFQKLDALAREQHSLADQVSARYSALSTRRRMMEELPDREHLPELLSESRALVSLAETAGVPRVRAFAHRNLGDMLASSPNTESEARPYYENALTFARASHDIGEISSALWALGRLLADVEPETSKRLIEEAIKVAAGSGNKTAVAYAWRQQMRHGWSALPFDSAAAQSMHALHAMETLRALQVGELASVSVFSSWLTDYYWLIGKLLTLHAEEPRSLPLAFDVAERMRATGLLEAIIDRTGRPAGAADPRVARRQALLESIATVQTKLLERPLDDPERARDEATLEGLEREEEEARYRPAAGALQRASLDQVQRALAADEALLSFTVGVGQNLYGRAGGGSWLTVVTRTGVRVIALADRTTLHGVISVARGTLDRPHPSAGRAAIRLYDLLLAEAMRAIGQGITRLLIIPDGPLHQVPFPRLARDAASPPLGAIYQLSILPSATVWLRWKQSARQLPPGALVLADPELPAALSDTAAASDRAWWPTVTKLGRLPGARREGTAVVARIGGRLSLGSEAAEAALKRSDFRSFSIVHLAAHSLVDEAHPDRSAILLASGDSTNDGLLQAREIADLPLDGHLIVLSACESATGAVIGGEGVVGLSRAFFRAGASAVIGTLWPIRDDHAAGFFAAFYESLGTGRSAGEALLDARRRAARSGVPAHVWSSVVLIGNDAMRVPAQPMPRSPFREPAMIVLMLAVVALGVWGIARNRPGTRAL